MSCSFSIVGCLLIIITFVASKSLRSKVLRQLLVLLSVWDLLANSVYIFGLLDYVYASRGWLCDAVALLSIYLPVASFVATDAISFFVFVSIGNHRSGTMWSDQAHQSKIMPISAAASCVIPVVLVALVAGFSAEGLDRSFGGPQGEVCWIRQNATPLGTFGWHLLGGKIVEWLSFIFVICCYVPTLRRLRVMLRTSPSSSEQRRARITTRRMVFVPAFFIVLRLPSAVRTIVELTQGYSRDHTHKFPSNSTDYLSGLSTAQAICDQAQGAVNGLIYVLCSDTVWKAFDVAKTWRGGDCERSGGMPCHSGYSEVPSTPLSSSIIERCDEGRDVSRNSDCSGTRSRNNVDESLDKHSEPR